VHLESLSPSLSEDVESPLLHTAFFRSKFRKSVWRKNEKKLGPKFSTPGCGLIRIRCWCTYICTYAPASWSC
jgi:hypothetical protein